MATVLLIPVRSMGLTGREPGMHEAVCLDSTYISDKVKRQAAGQWPEPRRLRRKDFIMVSCDHSFMVQGDWYSQCNKYRSEGRFCMNGEHVIC